MLENDSGRYQILGDLQLAEKIELLIHLVVSTIGSFFTKLFHTKFQISQERNPHIFIICPNHFRLLLLGKANKISSISTYSEKRPISFIKKRTVNVANKKIWGCNCTEIKRASLMAIIINKGDGSYLS